MKKLLKKRALLPIAVVAVLAIGATVALAWWSSIASTDNNSVSTGSVSMATGGLPITANNLVPIATPGANAADAGYGSVSYFWVHNTSSIPLMFYGYLSNGSPDVKNLAQYVDVRIWLLGSSTTTPVTGWTGLPTDWVDTFQPAAGGPFLSFDGTLKQLWLGEPAGINFLSSRAWYGSAWHDTPIGHDEYGVYRVAVWLDSSAPDSTQNAALTFTMNFKGMQQGEWDANNYDGTAFDPNLGK